MKNNRLDINEIIKKVFLNNASNYYLIDKNSKEKLKYSEILQNAENIASFFKNIGLSKGDRVAVLLDKSGDAVKIYFALLLSGIVIIPINKSYPHSQINFILNNSNAKTIICDFQLKIINNKNINTIYLGNEEIKMDLKESDHILDIKTLKKMDNCFSLEDIKLQYHDIFTIVYTSGTSSEPKGVIQSIGNIICNGQIFVENYSLDSDARFYNFLSMAYLGGYYNLLLIPFLAGGSVLLSSPFDASIALSFWKDLEKFKINVLWFVPAILSTIMKIDRRKNGAKYIKNNVKYSFIGMDFVRDDLINDYEKIYESKLLENYGLTETLFITLDHPSYKGNILENIEVKIVNDDGKKMPNEDSGEILIKTPFLMKRYIDSEISENLINGWFPTGDLGVIDKNSNLKIVGRKKDLIIKGGMNISPSSIEKVIYKLNYINECGAIGIRNDLHGEDIIVALSLDNKQVNDQWKESLINVVKKELSQNQQPDYYVILPKLPTTISGKIKKKKIKLWLADYFSTLDLKNENKFINFSPKKSDEINEDYFKPSRVVDKIIQATSIKLNNIVYEKKSQGTDVITLSLGEAFFDIPLEDFTKLPFPDIYHYSHSRGILELRKNIAKYFSSQYDVYIDPEEEIIITAGSKIAIYMSLLAVTNPGDEVIIPEPAWVSFPEQVKLCRGVPIQIPYDISVYDYENYITNRTKLIIINNPHNPTGKIYSLDELTFLYSLAEKYNIYILSDEAYSDFILDEDQFVSIGNLDKEKRRLILCNSISKNYGISGWRLGYVVTNKLLINQILKVNQHLITCPATILEYYISKYFFKIIETTKPQIKEVVERRMEYSKYMDSIGLKYLPGKGTFYFFVSIEGSLLSSDEFAMRLLDEYNIATVAGLGYGYSCDKFIRVAVGTENWDRTTFAFDCMKKLINET